jgi:hypothetical protein
MSIVKLSNNGVKNATAFGSISSLGSMTFIKKLTASSSATLSFVDGSDGVVLDDTYKEYLFTFKNIHASNAQDLSFQTSTNGGSSYGVTATTTNFRAYHAEDDSGATLEYTAGADLAQSTNFVLLNYGSVGTDNDDNCVGTLTLYNPSSTTFVKHFISNTNTSIAYSIENFTAGYFNSTSAINAVQFKMSIGNIDAGDICLYGIA